MIGTKTNKPILANSGRYGKWLGALLGAAAAGERYTKSRYRFVEKHEN